MIVNTLLTFYRISTRHPRYALLNLVGLGFGIAVFLTLGLFVRFETSFDDWMPDSGKIYEIGTRWTIPGRPIATTPYTMSGLLEELRDDFPDLVGTHLWELQATIHKAADVTSESEWIVDPEFFKVFDLPLIAGDKASALEPGKIMLTQAMARKYLGRTNVIGETIRISDEEGNRTYIISAVLKDFPHNSYHQFDFVRLLTPALLEGHKRVWHDRGSTSLETALRFETPEQAANLEAQLDAFSNRRGGTVHGGQPFTTIQTLRLLPYSGLHLHDPKNKAAVTTLGLVGMLAFAVAAVNFVNLATARAGMRAREVAVRRTLGATRGNLRLQFLGEALLMTILALIPGLSLVELFLPAINAACDTVLTLEYSSFLAELIGSVLVMGLLSGVYPALVLSAFQPAQILASSRSPAGGKFGIRVREALVVFQFATVIVLFIMTVGFVRQLDHIETADLGFPREGLMIVPSTYDTAVSNSLLRTILDAFRATQGVISVTTSDAAPGDDTASNSQYVWLPGKEAQKVDTMYVETGLDFFQTYGARLLAGRFLDLVHGDVTNKDKDQNIVLNARAVAALGFVSPEAAIGATLQSRQNGEQLHVVGVIDDLRFRSPKDELPAEYFYLSETPTQGPLTGIRYEGVPEPEMRARLEAAWKSAAPEVPLQISSAVDSLDKYYKPDRDRSHLFEIGALVAACIGCIGLYGMAAFTTSRRMLEVAVRKVLGASRGAVVRLLVGQFMAPVLLANLVAWPIGYFALSNWLGQFEDRIVIGPLPFLTATGVALIVAVGTVSALAFGSASAAPGKALRSE